MWGEITHGDCKGGTWVIDDDGLLTVDINGDMRDYGEGKALWYKYRDQIRGIHIGSKCTNIGRNGFYGLGKVEKVTGGENVKSVAMYAFQSCGSKEKPIPQIYFPKCYYVGEYAFDWAYVTTISLPLVYNWKAFAVPISNIRRLPAPIYLDLGGHVSMLRPGSVHGSYLFIENFNPPDFARELSSDEKSNSKGYELYGAADPFDPQTRFIVPKENLQRYIDYYQKNYGAFEGRVDGGGGYLCAGAPLYKDGQFLGCWFVDDDVLFVHFLGEMPSYASETAPWSEVLGTVEEMRLKVQDGIIPANAFKGGKALKGIKKITLSEIYQYNNMTTFVTDELTIGDSAFEGCNDLEEVTTYTNVDFIGFFYVERDDGAIVG